MHLGFAQGHADAQDGAFAIQPDAQGDEDGAVQQTTALADLLVTRVNKHIRETAQRAIAPGFQFDVQRGGALADLGGTDGVAAELFDDGGDFAGGNSLDIHFGEGQLEGLLAADALFKRAGIKSRSPRTCGTWNWIGPTRVARVLGLKPLAWPWRVSVRS